MIASLSRRIVGLIALVVILACVQAGFVTGLQDLAFTEAQTEISFWGRGTYQPSPEKVEKTGEALESLLRLSPASPVFLELQAHYFAWKAYWSDDAVQRETLGRVAIDAQRRALQSRPAHRQGWVKMVEYASRTRDGEAMRQFALDRLALLAPRQD